MVAPSAMNGPKGIALRLCSFPLSIPMMSIQTTERYVDAVTFGALGNVYELTGDLRYQNGWPEIVAGVAEVYDALSEEEQAACTIYAPSYALAGAVDLLGDEYGLPDAVSPHLTYYLWGPGDLGGDVVIAVRGHEESLRRIFEEVEVAGVAGSPDALPWLQQSPILVCRGLKIPLDELWPRMRSY